MKLSQVKNALQKLKTIGFQLPDGTRVPSHFHVTEVGKTTKTFIDCGGTLRQEEVANFQLWSADDYDHRLYPQKLMEIIELAEQVLKIENLEIEVEYQKETIGKFGLDFDGSDFLLTSKTTDCLAKDQCGIPAEKTSLKMANLQTGSICSPGGGCC